MMTFTAIMVASLFDPLRLATAIGSGFIPSRVYAHTISIASSLGWTALAAMVAAQEQSELSVMNWIAPAVSATLVTALVHWIRNRKKTMSPTESGE